MPAGTDREKEGAEDPIQHLVDPEAQGGGTQHGLQFAGIEAFDRGKRCGLQGFS